MQAAVIQTARSVVGYIPPDAASRNITPPSCFFVPKIPYFLRTSRLKCSECVRAGKPCVNMSWQSLDRTREELSSKIAEDEKTLATVITRLLRNKKILKEADAKARRKTQCLLSEVAGQEAPSDCPAADALIGLSPAVWSSMAMLDDFTNFGGDPGGSDVPAASETVVEASGSSQGS